MPNFIWDWGQKGLILIVQIGLRAVLGVTFATLGYLLANRYFPHTLLFGSSSLVPAIAAFVLGSAGIFLIPIVSTLAKKFFFNFVRLLAKELTEQSPLRRLLKPEQSEKKVEKKKHEDAMLLDTSAIIDGRISEIAKTGFLDGVVIVPRFILGELQHIADSADPLRRGRGRRGFEVIEELKKQGGVRVEISDIDLPKVKKVDDKLVQLGKDMKARVVTTDYNLNKVARISGVRILNVNELANSIRAVLLPGEAVSVKVIQEGKEKNQGVGYLADGTMVVVEDGGKMVGRNIEAEVARIFQTVAGRMVFVKPK
jgi:uncharacterized protein YacL